MGNRAVITTNENLNELGIYLHWHGSRNQVESFLTYCKLKGYRKPEDDSYGWVMLASVIANYIGTGISCDIGIANKLDYDNWDNGVYIIKDWLICGRMYYDSDEQLDYSLKQMLKDIDNKQPMHMRLTDKEWKELDTLENEIINV